MDPKARSNFKASGLTLKEWRVVCRAQAKASEKAGSKLTNREFLILMATDTSAKWRKA